MAKKILGIVVGTVCLSTVPAPTHAAVLINEIAWMGSDESTYAEWVELFNSDNTDVSLSGWTLSIVDKKDIALSGTITGKGYYVIERSSETRAQMPSTNLFTSFGTGISNESAKIVLKDSAADVDIVDATGEGGWKNVGGNKDTKQTPQRIAGCDKWVTAEPTPGAATVGSCTATAAKTNVIPTFPHIYIDGLEDATVSTFDNFEPEALVYSDDIHRVQYASIHWAFGDGSRDFGYHPRHVYEYPGEYVVDVRAESNNLKTEDSFIVTVDDADVRIAENSERGIGLYNADTRVIDLSNWRLKLGGASYELPEGTLILPGRTVIFPVSITKLKIHSDAPSLLYPNGKSAAVFGQVFALKPF